MGKVYFNARFDDVMLIVEHEMASMLGGPSLVGSTMLIIILNDYPHFIDWVLCLGEFVYLTYMCGLSAMRIIVRGYVFAS